MQISNRPSQKPDRYTAFALVPREFIGGGCEDDPLTFQEAIHGKINLWEKAIQEEIDGISSKNELEINTLPRGMKYIGIKSVYKRKLDLKDQYIDINLD